MNVSQFWEALEGAPVSFRYVIESSVHMQFNLLFFKKKKEGKSPLVFELSSRDSGS